MKKIILLLLLLPFLGLSQQDTMNIFDMDLEQLMNLKVKITSPEQEVSLKDAPGIVTIITEDVIKKSGARDLIDLLRLVPGFDFGVDIIGQVGVATRGNWAHEGKFLLMIDGQMMNEISYACTVFGFHYPVENIKRIEIIRGPGSAIYGGFAEMAVINIITKNGEDINGIDIGGLYGASLKNPIYSYAGYLNIGKKIGNLNLSLFAKYGLSHRSDFDYVDDQGNSFNLYENILNPSHLNFKLSYKNLDFITIYDFYHTTSRDYWGTMLSRAYSKDFTTITSMLKYRFDVSKKLTITPKFQYINQKPWASPDPVAPPDTGSYYNNLLLNQRILGNITAKYNITDNLNFILGSEYFIDEGKKLNNNPNDLYWNNKKSISYNTIAAFTQINWKNKFFALTFGTRFEKHNLYGGAFVPRIAIMKDFGKFNLKLLYNKAYRSPTIENIDYNYKLHIDLGHPTIKPEYTDFFNSELGWKITKKTYLNFDLYYIYLKDAIIYYIAENGNEGYENLGHTKTAGAEIELKQKIGKSFFAITYSYYRTLDNNISLYQIPSVSYSVLGLANNKATFLANIYISKNFDLNPSFIFIGNRYGFAFSEQNNSFEIKKFKPAYLLNFIANYNWKNFTFSFGGFNLLNQKYEFLQPYDGGHAPLPDRPLELIFKVQYHLAL